MILAELLQSGEFDWDDEKHREMYLKTWVKTGNGAFLDNSEGSLAQEKPVE